MAYDFQGKTAVVTGAAKGIGRSLARELASRGCARLLLADVDAQGLLDASAEIAPLGAEVAIHTADLTESTSRAALFDLIDARGWELDILVNNAGMGHWKYFQDAEWSALERILALNVCCTTDLTHRAVPRLVARGQGRIINVASTAALIGSPYGVTYSASKAYIAHLTETLDMELQKTGVRAACVFPGATETPFWDAAGMNDGSYADSVQRMTSDAVAREALAGVARGKARIVTGLRNRMNMLIVRFAPRQWLKKIALKRFSS